MSSMSVTPNVIALGRAYVRLVEAAQVIVGYTEDDMESDDLRALAKHYQVALRELLDKVPAKTAAEILAASEKVLGTVQDVGLN